MDFDVLLDLMVQKKASDLFITAGVAPSIKVNGVIMPVGKTPLTPEKSGQVVDSVMNEKQLQEFHETKELNFAISRPNVGRFRVSAFYQRNEAGMVLRRIESKIPTVEELSLPPILNELSMT
ncbi:MAG: type IV pili twitching motility protein PilT, partial [Porticoccus sp.]|nr:type IV pili twitching motility protein PilT [Porticoccus sp.]